MASIWEVRLFPGAQTQSVFFQLTFLFFIFVVLGIELM